MSNEALGTRMKEQYENRTRYYLPRRTYAIIRVDGKAFHTVTRHCDRPYDTKLMDIMNATACRLVQEIQGARFAFVQSDEISILLTDFETIETQMWFDGNIQKIASVSAAIAAATFTYLVQQSYTEGMSAGPNIDDAPVFFDSRVFTIADPIEVENYFIWRQKDATTNSISMTAQSQFSHKQLHGKSCDEMQEMLFKEKSINWNDYPADFKRGRIVSRLGKTPDIPIFTAERSFLQTLIPIHPDFVRK